MHQLGVTDASLHNASREAFSHTLKKAQADEISGTLRNSLLKSPELIGLPNR